MADVVPAGSLSVALAGLKRLLANVPFFQVWTGAANTGAAARRIFTGDMGFPISSVTIASGVVTVETGDVHGFAVGAVVTIEGASLGDQSELNIDGPQTLTAVSSASFQFAGSHPDLGTVAPDQAIVLPCPRPYAVVAQSDTPLQMSSIGTGGANVRSGALYLYVEADVSAPYVNDRANALAEAQNALGQLFDGLSATQETGDLMFISEMEVVRGVEFASRAQHSNSAQRYERWFATLQISWGVKS